MLGDFNEIMLQSKKVECRSRPKNEMGATVERNSLFDLGCREIFIPGAIDMMMIASLRRD